MAFGIQRKPLGDAQYSDADLAAMQSAQGDPSTGPNAEWSQPDAPTSAGGSWGAVGSGSGPREGAVGQAPPQMPTMMPTEEPRVAYGSPPPPPPPNTGGPVGAPGPSTATPSRSNEPSPVSGQTPNPEVAAAGGPPQMPSSFTPMNEPLGGQQIAQAAYPIERQDPTYGGWAGASDPTASYPITRRTIGPGPMTGGAGTQNRLLGAAGGLLGGGLGVPGLTGGSTQESTDIGNLIANLYRIANQNTQG